MEDFVTRFSRRRTHFEEFSQAIDDLINEDYQEPFIPSKDTEFWQSLDRIYAAGLNQNIAEVPWLASLTQVDDLGPMGRAMFLAFGALEALQEMPEATFAEGKRLWSQVAMDASCYRKVGVCKVLEASGYSQAIPLLQRMAEDNDSYVKEHAGWMIRDLTNKIASLTKN